MKQQSGFTLVELMLVIAILGILSSIAWGGYSGYVMDARRSEATTRLLELAQAQEKFILEFRNAGAYTTDISNLVGAGNTTTSNGHYNLAITLDANGDYTIPATAITAGPQAGDTGCTTINLHSNGRKWPADCWS